jgi:hypothetical protein
VTSVNGRIMLTGSAHDAPTLDKAVEWVEKQRIDLEHDART